MFKNKIEDIIIIKKTLINNFKYRDYDIFKTNNVISNNLNIYTKNIEEVKIIFNNIELSIQLLTEKYGDDFYIRIINNNLFIAINKEDYFNYNINTKKALDEIKNSINEELEIINKVNNYFN